jgi:putative effector of murein hydrolase
MSHFIPVIQHPVFSLLLTIGIFLLGQWCYDASGKRAWAQPFIIAFVLIIVALNLLPLSYSRYQANTLLLQQLLGTTTVALALPIYFHAKRIRQYFLPLLCTLVVSSVLTVGIAMGILAAFGLDKSVLVSMATKSITTPIAVAVSDQLGGSASLAASFVMITGVLGAMLGGTLLDRSGSSDQAARGIAFGVTAHALGTARALELNQECGAFSALAMGLNGILTALLLPFVIHLLY